MFGLDDDNVCGADQDKICLDGRFASPESLDGPLEVLERFAIQSEAPEIRLERVLPAPGCPPQGPQGKETREAEIGACQRVDQIPEQRVLRCLVAQVLQYSGRQDREDPLLSAREDTPRERVERAPA
jgi:hypothetical protein